MGQRATSTVAGIAPDVTPVATAPATQIAATARLVGRTTGRTLDFPGHSAFAGLNLASTAWIRPSAEATRVNVVRTAAVSSPATQRIQAPAVRLVKCARQDWDSCLVSTPPLCVSTPAAHRMTPTSAAAKPLFAVKSAFARRTARELLLPIRTTTVVACAPTCARTGKPAARSICIAPSAQRARRRRAVRAFAAFKVALSRSSRPRYAAAPMRLAVQSALRALPSATASSAGSTRSAA